MAKDVELDLQRAALHEMYIFCKPFSSDIGSLSWLRWAKIVVWSPCVMIKEAALLNLASCKDSTLQAEYMGLGESMLHKVYISPPHVSSQNGVSKSIYFSSPFGKPPM